MRLSVMDVATSMIAFTGFLVGLFAILYYVYQIKELNVLEIFLVSVIYINVNLLFLYMMRLTYER